MYLTFIKLLVSLSLLVCCGFVERVLYSRVVQGKDPRHRDELAGGGKRPARDTVGAKQRWM